MVGLVFIQWHMQVHVQVRDQLYQRAFRALQGKMQAMVTNSGASTDDAQTGRPSGTQN
jgi:hypothetical protein